MSPKKAQHVLELLAQGINPETGEYVAEDSALHTPSAIRALFLGSKALEAMRARSDAKAPGPPSAGKAWTADESQKLLAEFDAGMPVEQIASEHARSPGAIAARLGRLGRIDERADVYDRAGRAARPDITPAREAEAQDGSDISREA